MTDLPAPRLNKTEVDRRMPSLQLISDDDRRSAVRDLTARAPAYYWTRPGSTAGYHNAHKHGLWAHTLKLSTVIERLADSRIERGQIRPRDRDRAHAAAILHDQLKAGPNDADNDTARDHDWQMGARARAHDGINQATIRAIEEHMGPWYEGPPPASGLSELVHTADMIASDDNIHVALPAPAPQELLAHDYNEVELDG